MGTDALATHLSLEQLEHGLADIRKAPADRGSLELIVRRPAVGTRELVDEGALDPAHGLVGDNWSKRGSTRTADGARHPDMQLNVMSARVIGLIARSRDRWALAGDQLYVDLDLSEANLPPGTQLRIGDAVIEITPQPHTGCRKFVDRFGVDAMKFVNSALGRSLRLRGLNAKVVVPGTIRRGDEIVKVSVPATTPSH